MKRLRSKYEFSQIRGIQKLDRLAYILSEKTDYLIELAAQKNSYYKPFIDKQPGKKDRPIDQPTGELLRVQTKIRDRLLNLIPLSGIVFGAVEGRSTSMSAEHHLRKNVVVKLDLRDCFHSSKTRRVSQLFTSRFGFSKGVARLLTELCTFEGHVPVGSTLSSTLVNLILNPLWQRIEKYKQDNGLDATTWVDDLALSGKSAQRHINAITKMINGYGYRISWEKKEVQHSHMPQIVNGRGVNSAKVTIPKTRRRKIAISIKEDPFSDRVAGQLADASASKAASQIKQLKKLLNKVKSTTIPTKSKSKL